MEHPQLRLEYGLDKETKKARYIKDVDRGLSCNCVCPICNQDLVAKKGDVRMHHFAHNNGADECKGARMSMLHKLAQEVIQEECKVMLPEYEGFFVYIKPKLQTFDSVILEELCKNEDSKRRPDCIGFYDGKEKNIWIEIFCTNKIDESKKSEIRRLKQSCIEIDFSDLLKTKYTKEDVVQRLIEDSSHRKWVYCPDMEEEQPIIHEHKDIPDPTSQPPIISDKKEVENAKRELASTTKVDLIPNDKLLDWIKLWKEHECDSDVLILLKELLSSTNDKRARYTDFTKFKTCVLSYKLRPILTQGEVYELYKYAMLGAIATLEQTGREDLVDILLTDPNIRQQYIIIVSFKIKRPLFAKYTKINELDNKYSYLKNAYLYKSSSQYKNLDDHLKEIISITEKYLYIS